MTRLPARIYAVLLSGAAAVFAADVAGYAAISGFVRLADERRRATVAILAAFKFVSLCRDAESGQRGYLLTGDPAYLDGYARAVRAYPDAERKSLENPLGTREEEEQVRADVREKLAVLARTIDMAKAGRTAEAVAAVKAGRGKVLMDRIQSRVNRLITAASRAARAREARRERFALAALLLIPATGVLAPLLIVLAAHQASTQLKARVAAETHAAEADRRAKVNAEMLRALSHDVRTPLNAIAQSASLAETLSERGAGDTVMFRDALREVRAGAVALGGMLDSMLEVGRAGELVPKVERVPLARVVDAVAAVAGPLAHAKGLTFIPSVQPPGLAAWTDEQVMRRVVQNLAANAVKFTARGSVRVSAVPAPGGVCVSVSDTGPGIPAGSADKLFDDFEQCGYNPERDPRHGFGMGLAIVRRLTHAVGAETKVWSRPGHGTTFTVVFPNLEHDQTKVG